MKSTAQRVAALRKRMEIAGKSEVRGMFAPTKAHPEIKRVIRSVIAGSELKMKCAGLLLEQKDGYPLIDMSPSQMTRDEQIAYLSLLSDQVTATIAQLEHDSQ